MSPIQSFIFGKGTDNPTYESLKRRREVADLLGAQATGGTPKNLGEGINAVGKALASRYVDRKIGPQEDDERKRISDLLMGGGFQSMGTMGGGTPGFAPSAPPGFGMQAGASVGQEPPPEMRALPSGDAAARLRQGMIQRGMPEHVADGFLMNFQDESGFDSGINEQSPTVPGSRGGFGLAQWTGPRRVALEQYAAQSGRPVADENTQLDFLMNELSGSEKGAAGAIMQTRNPGEAAAAIATNFLRPAQQHLDQRVAQYTGGQGGGELDMSRIGELSEVLGNPYANEGQKAVAQALIGRMMEQPDPMQGLQMQKLQMEMAQMGQPEAITPYQEQSLALEREKMGQPPDPTDDMREYEVAKTQGFKGGLQDWILSQKKAGANSVVINPEDPSGTGNFYKSLDTESAKGIAAVMETAPEVGRTAQRLDQLEGLLANSPSGFSAIAKQAAGEWGIKTEGLDDIQAATAMINSMVPSQRPPGSGTMSDADLALFKASLPRLVNTPEGNQQIIATIRQINQYDQQMITIANQIASREIAPAEGRKMMQGVANPMEGFKPPPEQSFPGAPAAGTVIEGYRYKGGDPADMNSWEQL